MKILLIRHGKVSMEWKQRYTSKEFDEACLAYDDADILPVTTPQETGDYERIYVSSRKRSVQTARQMFPTAPDSIFVQTPLLDEVPLRSYCSTQKSHSLRMWNVRGRLQWRFGTGQEESYAATCARADELITMLEEKNENAILVTHGVFINVLLRRLKRRNRYEIYRASTFFTGYLEKIKVMDKQPHCGGCHHNCLLAQAGCMIGQDKARKAGLM